MTPTRTPSHSPARLSAPWLEAAPTQAVFAALRAGGFQARAVGGIVRNTLLGLPATDIDIATDAKPDDVMRLAEAAAFKTIPTGLAHGTVTVIASGHHFEITTLRRDIATDGRHATVAFTSDWAADAHRRDFTINALYCEADGTVFDPLGGLADLDPVRVRFIGDPAARIQEDYLRILRFFRFTAGYVTDGTLDADGLVACQAARGGLTQISGERIQAELFKLLTARHAALVTRALVESGVFASSLAVAPHVNDLARLILLEDRLGLARDAVRRLAALAVSQPNDVSVVNARLKLSASNRTRLAASVLNAVALMSKPDEPAAKILAYRWGLEAYQDAALLAWVRATARPGEHIDEHAWYQLATLPQRFSPPVLPISGRDLVALGYTPGPAISMALSKLEARWLDQGFGPDRAALLELARHGLMNGLG